MAELNAQAESTAGRGGRVSMAPDEAVKLFGALIFAIDRRREMSAWFRGHPRALHPEFGAILEWFVLASAGAQDDDRLAFAISCAQFALRIQRECRHNGMAATLTRLRAAPAALDEFNALISELNDLVAEEDLFEGDKTVHVARKFRDLIRHPALLIGTEPEHASLLLWTAQMLRTLYLHTLSMELLDLRIRVARTGLDPAPVAAAPHATLLDELAFALADLSEQSGDSELIREAARLHEQALSMTPEDGPERADRLNSLGACFRDLYHKAGEKDGLEKAIALFEESLALRAATVTRNNLAVSLLDRFRRDGRVADLDQATAYFAAIAADTPDDDLHLPRSLADRAAAQLARFGRTSNPADLDCAVELTERALALGPVGSVLVMCQLGYAEALSKRASQTRDRAEFDRAVSLFEQVRSGLPAGSVLAEQVAGQHVMAVMGWWMGDGSTDSLGEVVTTARAALAMTRQDRARRAFVAGVLLGTAPVYAASTGDVAELDLAIRELEEEAGCLAEVGIDAFSEGVDVRAGLARVHVERGRLTSSIEEVEQGLGLAAESADSGTRAELTARGWTERFMLSLDAGDLERALIAAERLAGTPDESFGMHTLWERLDDLAATGRRLADGRDLADVIAGLWHRRSARAGSLAGMGYAYLVSQARRFRRDGDTGDLERGIEVLERQLAAVPAETPRYRDLQVLAGSRWQELNLATGDPGHVTRAIAHLEKARESVEPDSLLFQQACGNLGTAFRARFNYTSNLADLDRAIAAHERSLDGRLDEGAGAEWATAVGNLANALRASYEYTRENVRLDRAIELHEQAVAALPLGDPDRSRALHNLANVHHTRYQATRDPAALDRAMAASIEAVDEMPAGTPMWQDSLSSLGGLYVTRFRATGDPGDLDMAVRLSREADGSVKASASSRVFSPFRLARALEARYDHGHDARDQAEAAALYRQICEETEPLVGELPMAAAWEWASWATRREAWHEAAQACRAGTRALGDLLRIQLSRGMRTRLIGRYRGFTAAAAYALTRAGDQQGAVMALETGRAVSFSEALELHSADVEWLSEHGHQELATRFETAVQHWLAVSGEGLDRDLAGGDRQPDRALSDRDLSDRDNAIRAARAEIDRLVGQIREVSGKSEFLRPPVFADVAAAAATEPLVYLVAAGPGGVALIVRDHQIHVLDLPELTEAAVSEWAVSLYIAYAMGDATLNWRTRLESLGRELWDAVIGPVAEALGGGPVTLVPTGYLEVLPLNAAWMPDENRPSGRRYAVDELTLRNAPNARVLAAARIRAGRTAASSRLLAVEDPQPVSAPSLTSAAAEVAGVRCRFAESTVLAGPQATAKEVIARLSDHDIVHFACHGRLDPQSPLDNSLILADDMPLTLRDIMRTRLDREGTVRLGVLSACETSIAGFGAPDEVISLPSGLLEAGVAGVVASRWRVPDLSAAILMVRFYAEWTSTGDDPAAALQAAQRWMRDSTNKEMAGYFAPASSGALPIETTRPLWRSLATMDPERRGFAHPAHWAGFVFSGA